MRKVKFTAPPTALIEGPSKASVSCSPAGCWAGYIATGHDNYNSAAASWVEPTIGSSVYSGPLAELLWVGLGGWNNPSLGQDGTGYGEGDPHGPWWEVLPANYVFPGNWDASPRDTVSAAVSWDATINKYQFNVIDGSHSMTATESGSYAGKTADFILENPTMNGSRSELENVEKVPWSNARAIYGTSGVHN